MAVSHSFLWLSNIPVLFIYATSSLSIQAQIFLMLCGSYMAKRQDKKSHLYSLLVSIKWEEADAQVSWKIWKLSQCHSKHELPDMLPIFIVKLQIGF